MQGSQINAKTYKKISLSAVSTQGDSVVVISILPGRSGVQVGAAQHQFGWILGQCQALLNGGGPDQAVCSCDVSNGFDR